VTAEPTTSGAVIGRGSPQDLPGVRELLLAEGWDVDHVTEGEVFVARQGGVVGCVRVIEVGAGLFLVDDVMVRADRRGSGLGADLMRAALAERDGTAYLACHPERIAFYTRLGFGEDAPDRLPPPVRDYFRRSGDLADSEHAREHHFMRRP